MSDPGKPAEAEGVRWTPHATAVAAPMPDGGVVLHLRTKQYFVLNSCGWVVWNKLQKTPSTLAELVAALTSTFEIDGETAGRDVLAVLGELEREELVTRA